MKSIEFNGNGTEYFKIWIVNILLTIVTLGIYYPWAKVRSRRYFYGNTELGNANFEYHATGKQLFLSFIIAMLLFAAYVILASINPIFSVVLAVALMLAAPWIIWRSIKFNLRMISYRNVRFGFKGNVGGAYAIFLGYPIGMLIALAIIVAIVISVLVPILGEKAGGLMVPIILVFYPVFFALLNKITSSYITNGTHFGQGDFAADFKFKPFFMIMLKGMGLGILLSIIVFIVIGVLAYLFIGVEQITALGDQFKNMDQGVPPAPLFFILIFAVYALLILVSLYVMSYLKARHRTYIFGETRLDNSISFESTFRTNTFFGITVTNLLLMIFTLGLAYPWVAVRTYRYLSETVNVDAPEGLDGYISKQGSEGAIGEELGEAFDIDVGGIAF
ncbi:MAG: hypothetical protein COA95_08535 [Methylophaga sp.]|nr:MAG: hypothetical protein COA95_08535 [Methylophaga sp.]